MPTLGLDGVLQLIARLCVHETVLDHQHARAEFIIHYHS